MKNPYLVSAFALASTLIAATPSRADQQLTYSGQSLLNVLNPCTVEITLNDLGYPLMIDLKGTTLSYGKLSDTGRLLGGAFSLPVGSLELAGSLTLIGRGGSAASEIAASFTLTGSSAYTVTAVDASIGYAIGLPIVVASGSCVNLHLDH